MSVTSSNCIPRQSDFEPELARSPIVKMARVIAFPSKERAFRVALVKVWREIGALVGEGLRAKSADEWISFWSSRMDLYLDSHRTITGLAKKIQVPEERLEAEIEKARRLRGARFPEADHDLRFIEWTAAQARRRVERFARKSLLDSSRQAEDREHAASFNHWALWYGISLTSLSCMSDPESKFLPKDFSVDGGVVDCLMVVVREAAFEMSFASTEAAELREAPVATPIDEGPFERIAMADDDLVDAARYLRRLEQAKA